MKHFFSFSVLVLLILVTLSLAACDRSSTKDVPADKAPPPVPLTGTAAPSLPPGHPPILSGGDMASQTLPSSALAEAGNPTWTVPPGWEEGKASSIRRGSWVVHGEQGQSADIAVTAFPGDVGGPLANINRWRGQIGLGAITEEEADSITTKLEFNGLTAIVVDMTNEKLSPGATYAHRMLVATIAHEGNSWFVKMTGAAPLVGAQKEAFLEFVKSFKF